MHIDLVLSFILISLGAMIFYIVDEHTGWTPRLADWLSRVMDR